MSLTPKPPFAALFLGCLIVFLSPRGAGSVCVPQDPLVTKDNRLGGELRESERQYSLVVYGVERQRQEDHLYDHQWMIELTRRGFDPIVYSSKAEMVEKILSRLGAVNCISKLNLFGHGKPGLFALGRGELSDIWWSSSYIYSKGSERINDWKTPMAPLKGRFCRDATITLTGCYTGAGEEGAALLFELAKFFGVTVRAPVDEPLGGMDYPENGNWQVATPQMTQPPPPKRVTTQPHR